MKIESQRLCISRFAIIEVWLTEQEPQEQAVQEPAQLEPQEEQVLFTSG